MENKVGRCSRVPTAPMSKSTYRSRPLPRMKPSILETWPRVHVHQMEWDLVMTIPWPLAPPMRRVKLTLKVSLRRTRMSGDSQNRQTRHPRLCFSRSHQKGFMQRNKSYVAFGPSVVRLALPCSKSELPCPVASWAEEAESPYFWPGGP